MKSFAFIISLLVVSHCYGQSLFSYPETLKQDVVDTIWGKTVNDPYRWLEDRGSARTKEWIKAQEPLRDKCRGKLYLSLLDNLSLYSEIEHKPIFKEGKYFFMYRVMEENKTAVLFYQKSEDKSPRYLFDPNQLDKSARISIADISVSDDNKTIALVLSRNSGDWKTVRFLTFENKKLLNDTVSFVKYSPIYWAGNGIFYIRYDVQNISESFSGLIKGRSLYYHKLGTRQTEDSLIYKPESEFDDFSFEVTPEKHYLILYYSKQKGNDKGSHVSLLPLPVAKSNGFRDFISSKRSDIYFDVLGEINNKILVRTNLNAANGAIYKYSPEGINKAEILVPQFKQLLEYSKLIGNKIIRVYNDNTRTTIKISDQTGKDLTTWQIPEGYKLSGFSGSNNDSIALYHFNSFFSPSSDYKINLNTYKREPLGETKICFNNKDLTTEKVYYSSEDSTLVPMYITHMKDMVLNGKNPTILYGYGGFGVSMKPFFNVANVIFLKNGGVLATPCLRGGGDYPDWHRKGKGLNKQKTFDDFIYAAKYLIANKYTNPDKIAAMGGSNGGLVVGACMVQRPDLFKVVVAQSGVFDMMRYHLFNVGYVYKEEFGNIKDSVSFINLLSYSPVNNVKPGVDYPATLLVASDNDDRVLPFHSFKFIANLQASGNSVNPYVIYFQDNAGHSGSNIFKEYMATEAYIYSFIYKFLGIEKKIQCELN
jgi:prolyl oligopeptidase